jgi:hypothetical protein
MAFTIKLLVNYLLFIGFLTNADYCNYDQDEKYLNCNDFETFDELNEDLEKFGNRNDKINKFRMSPKKSLKLEKDSVQLRPIQELFEDQYDVIWEKIDGFEFNANPFDRIKTKARKLELNDVKLSFVDKQDRDISSNCNLDIFSSDLQLPLFSEFKIVHLNQKINYAYPICPILFKRSSTQKLLVNDASNKFKFTSLKTSSKNRFLNSSSIIEYELLNVDAIKIDQILLNEELFTNLEKFKFKLSSTSNSNLGISSSIFNISKKMKEFYLEVDNFGPFFKSSLEWISNLNNDISKNQFKLIFKDINEMPYEYLDEDFCIFSKFPHEKNIFPIIKYSENYNQTNCSCTLLWLSKNYASLKDDQNIYYEKDSAISGCIDNFDDLYLECNMTSRLDYCRSLETTLATTTQSTTRKRSTTTISFPFGFVSVSKNPIKEDNTNTIIFIVVGVLGTILFAILFSIYLLRSRKRTNKKKLLIKQHYLNNDDEVNIII